MSSERERFESHYKKAQLGVALSLGFVGTSAFFPPAIAGAAVTALDVGRNVLAMNLILIKSPKNNGTKTG